jgi:hypothetical protein
MPVRTYIYRGDRERHYPYPPVRQVLAPGDRIDVDDRYYPHDIPLDPEDGGVHWPRAIRDIREIALDLAGHADPEIARAGADLHALADRMRETPDPAPQDTVPGDETPTDSVSTDEALEDLGPDESADMPEQDPGAVTDESAAAGAVEAAAPSGNRPPIRRAAKGARTKEDPAQ